MALFIHPIVLECFDLFTAIKHDMKTAQKIVNNIINENIFPLMISSLKLHDSQCVV